jgi:hypothetical protein
MMGWFRFDAYKNKAQKALAAGLAKAADPTESSRVVFPNEKLKRGPPNEYNRATKIDSHGRHFHLIEEDPELQQCIARILKPFMPVADIIRHKDGHYYSYEAPIENIRRDTTEAEMRADFCILSDVFGDDDHDATPTYDVASNVNLGKERYMLYDFHHADAFFFSSPGDKLGSVVRADASTLLAAQKKLETMRRFYDSQEGKDLIASAFASSGKSISELFKHSPGPKSTVEDFRKKLINKIDRTLELVAWKFRINSESKTPGDDFAK